MRRNRRCGEWRASGQTGRNALRGRRTKFSVEQLQAADLVKGRISDVLLQTLSACGHPRQADHRHFRCHCAWHGLLDDTRIAVAISVAFVGAQIVVGMIFSAVAMSRRHGRFDGPEEVANERTVPCVGNLRSCSGHRSDMAVRLIRKGISVFDYLG